MNYSQCNCIYIKVLHTISKLTTVAIFVEVSYRTCRIVRGLFSSRISHV